ncbi:MAG: DNA topoisomerase VI subunit B [Vicinamibacteria bacterium]|nr:DNA topoisomerase VI subunit B [Vicinamibacteria bacterium]
MTRKGTKVARHKAGDRAADRRKSKSARAQLELFTAAKSEPVKTHEKASPAPPPAGRPPVNQSPLTATRRATAEVLAQKQREISVSEFFVKNRHLLGFDNPQKALLTAVRECVDNSLDACSDAGILPSLRIEIVQRAENRFRISVEDNGPGIVRGQIPKIFGKLLYGSKFHTLKQQRGQQGIGVSAAGMYGQLTTGKPVTILSRTGPNAAAHHFDVTVDTKKNQPLVLRDEKADWDVKHGTRVTIELEAIYKRGRRSVDDYIEQTALANPHAEIHYAPPNQEALHYPRAVSVLPQEPKEIKPHPYGVELGMLMRLLQDTPARTVAAALKNDFSRVSDKVVAEVTKSALIKPNARPRDLTPSDVERLHAVLQNVKLMSPATNCLSPIGEESIRAGLSKRFVADYVDAVTRPPSVYRGNPFQVEIGLAYGGDIPADELIDLYRLANRVPLQYQSSACAITKAVLSVDWRAYAMSMSKGALPTGPMILMIHIASVWVPFTSESKEAIAHYPEIIRELRLALMELGRRLASHIRHRRRVADEAKKKSYIDKFIPHIGIALRQILALAEREEKRIVTTLRQTLERSRERMV